MIGRLFLMFLFFGANRSTVVPITGMARSRDVSYQAHVSRAPQVLPAPGRTALRPSGTRSTPEACMKPDCA